MSRGRRLASGVLSLLVAFAGARLLAQASAPALAAIPRRPSPGIEGVITAGTRPQVIATGLMGADDPIWVPNVGLLFTEPDANRVVRLWLDDEFTTFLAGLHKPLGMTFDARGRLISIQSEPGFTSVRVVWPEEQEAVIADRFDGLAFSRPNGITVDRSGGVYFSDPGLSPEREAELRKTERRLPPSVYYVPAGGMPVRVADGIARPNGVHLSVDERTLFVNDTNGVELFAFDVRPDGGLANRRVFATYAGRTVALGGGGGLASGADDLVVDGEGRIYSITAAGIEVLSPAGRALGIIPAFCTPSGARCQALAFGGVDKRTLFVAGAGTLLKYQMVAQGFTGRAK